MFDSTLIFDESLVLQGLVNGMKGFEKGMTGEAAQMYIQTTMQKRQERNMPPIPAEPEAPADSVN